MTSDEVEEIKGHFDKVAQELRGEMSEFRRDSAEVADHLMGEIADARREAVAHTEELRTLIHTVAEGVVLANARLDALTQEVRSGFADVPRRNPPPRRH